jgi:hypothetical protein
METYSHIKTVLGIILGLSITHSLKGAVKLIDHPNRIKSYPVHLLWAFYMFLSTVYFWWFEVHLTEVKHWDFLKYFFLVIYVITYFVLAALLFPDDLRDYKDYRAYFYSRKKWFFSLLALLFAFDAVDTYLKGPGYQTEMLQVYPIREILHIAGCIWAANTEKGRVQLGIVLLFILFQVFWIMRYYLNG